MAATGKRQNMEGALVAEAGLRRWWPFFLKLAVSTLLIGFLVVTHDLSEALSRLRAVDRFWFLANLLLLGGGILLAALRWRMVLDGIGVALSFAGVLRIVFVGLFFNQVLPSSIGGDAVRAWQIHRLVASAGVALQSVLLDRLAGLGGLVLLVVAGLPMLFRMTADGAAQFAMMGLAFAAILGLALILTADRLPLAFLGERLHRGLMGIAREGRALLLAFRRAPSVLGLSCGIHVFSALSVFCLAQGLGIALGLFESLVLVPPVILLMVLPISLAGWGVREGAMIAALGFVGVASADALLLSIAFGLSVLLTNLPGGALWFLTRNAASMRQEAVKK